MAIAKVQQHLRTATSDGDKLTEEKEFNPKSAAGKDHLRDREKYLGKLDSNDAIINKFE